MVRFGGVEVNLDTGEVVRSDRRLSLPDQPLRILVRLIDSPGTVISRDDLRRELWADDTFVDFEHGLNSAIKRLRDALGDSADTPRYIETIPRRGYRFIGELEPPPPPRAETEVETSPSVFPGPRRTYPWLPIVIVAALVVAGVVGWQMWGGADSSRSPATAVTDNRILVAVLDPASGARSPSGIGKLAADQLIATISRVETADVLPASVASASSEAAIASALGSGAALVVEVVSQALESDRLFEARIHDTRARQVLYFSPRFKATMQHPSADLEPLAEAVAGAVAVHLDPGFGGLQVTSEPPLLESYLEYRAGGDLFERDYPRAVARFQRASQISPGYLLPRLVLVMAYDNQGDHANAAAQMAQIADNAHRLTAGERLLVEYMRESLARRTASALRALLEAEKLAPRSYIINYGIQQEALLLNKPRIGVAAFDRLPTDNRARRYNGWRFAALTRSLHLLGDHTRELAENRRAQEYEAGNALYAQDEVRARAALGDVTGVGKVIDDLLATPVTSANPASVMEQAARELRVHGHAPASLKIANRGADWLSSGQKSGAANVGQRAELARLLYLAERWSDADALFARLVAERPDAIEYIGYRGAIAARQLDRRRAAVFDERLRQFDGREAYGAHLYWRAAIAALFGERDRAVALLRDAFGQGHDRGLRIHASPEFESLRDFPPFAALVAPGE